METTLLQETLKIYEIVLLAGSLSGAVAPQQRLSRSQQGSVLV